MKKLLFACLICTTMVLSVSALPKGDKETQEMSQIINLEATKASVIKVLGEPDKILAQKERSFWSYAKEDKNIKIQWDETTATIAHLEYSSRKKRDESWNSEWQSDLNIDKSTYDQVLSELGMPDGIIVNNTDKQNMVYKYANYILNMRFDKGVLAEYELKKA